MEKLSLYWTREWTSRKSAITDGIKTTKYFLFVSKMCLYTYCNYLNKFKDRELLNILISIDICIKLWKKLKLIYILFFRRYEKMRYIEMNEAINAAWWRANAIILSLLFPNSYFTKKPLILFNRKYLLIKRKFHFSVHKITK